MRKVLVVAVREYQAAVRTKAFIVSLVLMPVFFGGSLLVQGLLKDKVDTTDRKLALVDYTGQVAAAVVQAAEERNTTQIYREEEGQSPKQVKPKFVIELVEPRPDRQKLELELSDAVREQKYFAFVILPADIVAKGEDVTSDAVVAYHSNSPTYDDLANWLRPTINERVHALRFDRAGLDPELVKKVTSRVPVDNLKLVEMDAAGNIVKAEKANELANIFVPMGMMMLMLMVVMVGSTPLMNSVLEEKMQRIAEVLLGSVAPFQLMLGKLLGMVGVALTISTIYLVGAFFAVQRAGYGEFFPAEQLWWFLLYQALAVLMFGSLFAAVGAAVTDIKESQSLVTPVMLVIMLPLFIWINVIREPTSSFSVIASLIPTATPFLMPMRQAVPPGVPLWQPLLGVGLVVITTLIFVFAAGRIFRVGILMQGKGARVGEMIRWIWSG